MAVYRSLLLFVMCLHVGVKSPVDSKGNSEFEDLSWTRKETNFADDRLESTLVLEASKLLFI